MKVGDRLLRKSNGKNYRITSIHSDHINTNDPNSAIDITIMWPIDLFAREFEIKPIK